MRSFDASSSNDALRDASASPTSASTMCRLLYNAALKFDALFNVPVFPLDVGKRFARLITHALREVPHCDLDQASIGHYDAVGSKKPLLLNGIVRPL
jgi:hypothetical protein